MTIFHKEILEMSNLIGSVYLLPTLDTQSDKDILPVNVSPLFFRPSCVFLFTQFFTSSTSSSSRGELKH
jgi:hypothetical protein